MQRFQNMIDSLLENLLKELNISSELFLQIIEQGMRNPQDKIVFEQIVACNNFLSFKKLMTRRNKEIEVEVVRSMKHEGVATEEELEIALEKQEIAEVGYALALSIAWEEEQRRKAREAEEELQRILRESEAEYRLKEQQQWLEEEARRKKREEDDRLSLEKLRQQEEERLRLLQLKESKDAEDRRLKEEQALRFKQEEERRRREQEELESRRREEEERKRKDQEELDRISAENQRLKLLREEEERKRQLEFQLKMEEMKRQRELELEAMKKKAQEDAERLRLEIEAMNAAKEAERNSRPRMSLIPMQAMNLDIDVLDINKGRVDLTKELQEAENLRRMTQGIIRRNEGNRRESVADREEKMQKQRELLLAKKKMEREQQIKEFKDSGGLDLSQDGPEGARDTGAMRKRNSILEARKNSYKYMG